MDARPSGSLQPPLDGIRVISAEQFGAGPWATMQLADLGAEVIKIENPARGGDVGRTVPPYAENGTSLFFEAFNRGKKSVELDLLEPAGRGVFEDLVREADVVFSNLRGDLPARLGLDYAALEGVNPALVCCSLSGFGMTGPRAAQPAYDYVIQGLAGWMSVTGEPDGPPAKSGLSLVDFASGYAASVAVLAGLRRAQETGRGCDCDISLFETALSLLNYVGTWAATAGYEPERLSMSAHPSIVPFQVFAAADGWIVIACAKQKFWLLLCQALGRPELAEEERFADFAARARNRHQLQEILQEAFSERPAAEWISTLEAVGVPCGPVNSVAEAFADPQAVSREATVSVAHPVFGTVRHIASPLRTGATVPPRPAPRQGGDNEEILSTVCGYDAAKIEALRRSGAFGPPGPGEQEREGE